MLPPHKLMGDPVAFQDGLQLLEQCLYGRRYPGACGAQEVQTKWWYSGGVVDMFEHVLHVV